MKEKDADDDEDDDDDDYYNSFRLFVCTFNGGVVKEFP